MSDQPVEEFRIDERRTGDAVVLVLHGDLDLGSSDALSRRLDALRAGGEPTVLDLDGLGFMDSSGLRVVLQAAEAGRDGGWPFGITRGSEAVRRLFAAAGIADRLPIVPAP